MKNTDINKLSNICFHTFTLDAIDAGYNVFRALDTRPGKLETKLSRDLDEHEFFLTNVSKALVEVLYCCDHLATIPFLLSNYKETPSLKRVGMDREKYITYQVENYIVRVQGLYDRLLVLINSVFHLLNDQKNCRKHIILKNIKVEITSIPSILKKLENLITPYSKQRNEITHFTSFKDQDLYTLSMFNLIARHRSLDPQESDSKSDIVLLISDSIREIVTSKKKEFLAFNETLADAVIEVLNSLVDPYKKEEHALRLRTGKQTGNS